MAAWVTERFLLEAALSWISTLGRVDIRSRSFPYGGVAEWLKAPDCKSGHYVYVGSNPTPSTTSANLRRGEESGHA